MKKIKKLEKHIQEGKKIFDFPNIKRINNLNELENINPKKDSLIVKYTNTAVFIENPDIRRFIREDQEYNELGRVISGGIIYHINYDVDKGKLLLQGTSLPNGIENYVISERQIDRGEIYKF